MRALMLALLVACKGPATEPTITSPPTGSETTTETELPPVDCNALPELPLSFDRIDGYTNAEDFAFDLDGRYWATDRFGNVVKIRYGGEKKVVSPNFGESAGTVFDKDGYLLIANVSGGSLERIDPDSGGKERILGGLAYPNGVTVDLAGWIYVAEQDSGQVRRIDPATGDDLVIATGLFNPNGLAVSPDQSTLYVGSFGGGTIHAIDLTDVGGETTLFAETPGGGVERGCEGLAEGDECFLEYVGLGECGQVPGGLGCVWSVDTDACAGLLEGDACATTALGEVVDSVCATSSVAGQLFCPKVPGEVVTACAGGVQDGACNAMGQDRTCRESWEGVLVCDTTPWEGALSDGCEGLASGDDCVILDYEGPADGTCATVYGSFICDPGWYGGYQSFNGGLDGVAADECGNVYVTEYTVGLVWRFPPGGGEAELAIETGTFWIPNLHWGNGTGGWDPRTLYVQDRAGDEMLAVDIGVGGAPVAYAPE